MASAGCGRASTAEVAAGELSGVVRATDTQGGPEPPTNAVVTPIQSYLLGPAEPVLWTLLGGAALMLLVACANVAGLQVSRAARRERALAVRLALGARHGHLVRQSIAESVLITTAASGGAVAVCLASVRGLLLLAPADVPRLETVSLLDVRVLAFAAAVAFLTVLVCGLWPALVVGRLDTLSVLAHGPATTGLPRGRLVQRLVVTAQVALALTLLVGTALFVRTVLGLDRTVLGFEPDHLLAVEMAPAGDDLDRWNHTYAAIEARVAALPGVTSVGAVYLRPLSGPIGLDNQPFFPGQVAENPTTWGLNPHHNLQTVTPGYFEAMGIKVVRGRGFLATDTLQSPGVVVVSQQTARRFWPGLDPIGQRLSDMSYRRRRMAPPLVWQTVVGVVDDVRYRGLNDVRLDTYVPAAQSNQRVKYLMVRSSGDAADVAASVRAAAIAVDPRASVAGAARDGRHRRGRKRAVALRRARLPGVRLACGAAERDRARHGHRARREHQTTGAGHSRGARRRPSPPAGGRHEGRHAAGRIRRGLAGLACALALGRAVAAVLVGVQPHDPIALLPAATRRLRRRAHRVLVAVATCVRRPIPSRRCGPSSQPALSTAHGTRHPAPHSAPGTLHPALLSWRSESLRLVVEHQHPVEHLAGIRRRERALARVRERADGGCRAGARD